MDVFISHSSKDKSVADATCAALEQAGFRCWIAPRNIQPGTEWSAAIIEGIESSRLLVLVLTKNSNLSPQVLREVERAVAKGLPIVPLRVEQVQPAKGLEFFISSQHWLDAFTPPLAHHLARLTETARALLQASPADAPYENALPAKAESIHAAGKKHWGLVAAGTIAALALVAGIGAWLTWQASFPAKPAEGAPTSEQHEEPADSKKATHQPLFSATIAERFRRWDDDRDGLLAVSEIRRAMTNMKGDQKELAQRLWRLDLDGDGNLSEQELLRLGYNVVEHRDGDGDGRYTLAEFRARHRGDGGKESIETLSKVFRNHDVDNDGYVTVAEQERSIAIAWRGGD